MHINCKLIMNMMQFDCSLIMDMQKKTPRKYSGKKYSHLEAVLAIEIAEDRKREKNMGDI